MVVSLAYDIEDNIEYGDCETTRVGKNRLEPITGTNQADHLNQHVKQNTREEIYHLNHHIRRTSHSHHLNTHMISHTG